MKRRNKRKDKYKPAFKIPKLPRINRRFIAQSFEWLLLIVVCICVLIVIYLPWPTVKNIDCSLSEKGCPPGISELLLGELSSVNYLKLNQKIIEDVLKITYPTLLIDSVTYNFPTNIYIQLSHKEPAMVILTGSEKIIIDETGTRLVVDDIEKLNVPIIESQIKYPSTGNIKDSATIFALKLHKLLDQWDISTKKISISNSTTIVVQLTDNRQVMFSSNSDLTRQVTSLQLILNATTIKPDLPIIDVRFDKPVLKPKLES